MPDALPLARRVYAERSSSGCCLHIVLDDDNLEDRNVEFCVLEALRRGHEDCYVLAAMLRSMTRSQRGRVARLIHRPRPVLVGDPVEVHWNDEWIPGVIDGFHPALEGEPWSKRVNVRSVAAGLFFRGCHPSHVRRPA